MSAMDGGPIAKLARARLKREMLRRMRELDKIDAKHGVGTRSTLKPLDGPRSHRSRTMVAWVVSFAVVALVVSMGTSGVSVAIRSALSLGHDPLATVPLLPEGDGSFAFMKTQRGKPKVPVTYDPCKKIELTINPDGAPDDYRDYVETAADHISSVSGLKFAIVGTTDERPSENRPAEDVSRYGRGWSPVLVAWSDNDEIPELAGDVAGLGGSSAATVFGKTVYVTGGVTLDRESFDEMLRRPGGRAQAQAIIDHEFGHLVGLDHVKDRGELMNAENNGRTTWGPGDKAGLSRLGRGPCIATF